MSDLNCTPVLVRKTAQATCELLFELSRNFWVFEEQRNSANFFIEPMLASHYIPSALWHWLRNTGEDGLVQESW